MSNVMTFVGWYGRNNVGDEAFKEVHKHLFKDVCPVEWFDDRGRVVDAPERSWVLGGGDVLSDFYARRIPANRSFSIYGVGVGGHEEFSFITRHKDRIKAVWVRNQQDADKLVTMGVNAHFTPDIVFQLKSVYAESKARDAAGDKKRKRLVLFLSANAAQAAGRANNERLYHYYEFFKRELALVCDFLSEYYQLVFYPLSTEVTDDDRIFSQEVHALMKKPGDSQVLPGDDAIDEVVQMVKNADMVLSMKFHGIVFSILSEVPFVNLGLSRKTQLLCKENGLDYLSVEPFGLSYHQVAAAVKRAEQPASRLQIAKVSGELAKQAAEQGAAFRDFVMSTD